MVAIIPILKMACTVLSVVSTLIDSGFKICKTLGILDKNANKDELGDRYLQARDNGIRVDDYAGRFEEYRDKIASFELDPEKSKAFTAEQKNEAAGQFIGWALAEHYGEESGIRNFIEQEANRHGDFYSQKDRLGAYLETFKDGGMDKIGEYFDNKLGSVKDIETVEAKLAEAEKKAGFSDKDAMDNLDREVEKRAES